MDYERSHLPKRISCIRRLQADFQKSRAEYGKAKAGGWVEQACRQPACTGGCFNVVVVRWVAQT